MRAFGWLKSLPEGESAPSRPAALWLLGAALLLWPIDTALTRYGNTQWQTYAYDDHGMRVQTVARPLWVGLARLGVGALAAAVLVASGRVSRRDLGLTLGRPRVTLFWVGFPLAVMTGAGVVGLAGAGLLVRATGWAVPPEWLEPYAVFAPALTGRVAWEYCVIAPLVEELLYRGVPLQALERVWGRGWAVVLGGAIWAGMHLAGGHPPARAPLYFLLTGALFAWAYLKSRSLVTTVLLHAAANLAVPVGTDLALLYHRDAIGRLLDPG